MVSENFSIFQIIHSVLLCVFCFMQQARSRMERRYLVLIAVVFLFGLFLLWSGSKASDGESSSSSSASSASSHQKSSPSSSSSAAAGAGKSASSSHSSGSNRREELSSNDDKDTSSATPKDPNYPTTRPDRTLALTSPYFRKTASLCGNRQVAVGKQPIPWIVDDTVIGLDTFEALVEEESENWGYRWKDAYHQSGHTVEEYYEDAEKAETRAELGDSKRKVAAVGGDAVNNNDNNNHEHEEKETTVPPPPPTPVGDPTAEKQPPRRRCSLPYGHVRRILARTRISATITAPIPPKWLTAEGTEQSRSTAQEAFLLKLNGFLKTHAPAWRIQLWRFADHSQQRLGDDEHHRRNSAAGADGGDLGGGHIVLERRAKAFVFAITGGNLNTARRARYAEWTWGARTPITWFGDQWDSQIRPIVEPQHPLYLKDRFKYLTFKISRVWQIVHERFGGNGRIDWFVRLWDDNYFYEENLFHILYRMPNLNPQKTPVLAGKLGIRHLGPADAVFPFAGGGAGWYLSKAAMERFGPSILKMEEWIPKLRARKDIFLPHDMHDEDVFLTAWIGKFINVSCLNIPGVEHVSPGMGGKQRCMSDEALKKLRWDPKYTVFFDYTGRKQRHLRVEDTWYSYTKPLVWHYMSPRRLLRLEKLLYEARGPAESSELPTVEDAPATVVDNVKKNKRCYPGVPEGEPPVRDISIFEQRVPQAMLDKIDGGAGGNGNADPEPQSEATGAAGAGDDVK